MAILRSSAAATSPASAIPAPVPAAKSAPGGAVRVIGYDIDADLHKALAARADGTGARLD